MAFTPRKKVQQESGFLPRKESNDTKPTQVDEPKIESVVEKPQVEKQEPSTEQPKLSAVDVVLAKDYTSMSYVPRQEQYIDVKMKPEEVSIISKFIDDAKSKMQAKDIHILDAKKDLPPVIKPEHQVDVKVYWDYLRKERNRRLAMTDFINDNTKPMSIADRANVYTYRKELRDLPQQSGAPWTPDTIPWPAMPRM